MKERTKRTIGIILMAAPIPLLAVTLMSYAILSFVGSVLLSPFATGGFEYQIIMILQAFLGFLGFVSVFGTIIGIPVGIVLFVQNSTDSKKDLKHNPHYKK